MRCSDIFVVKSIYSYFPIFSSASHIIMLCIFRSLIDPKLIFVDDVR